MILAFLNGVVIVLILAKIFCLLTTGWCKSNVCLVGKTALIVGGNTGIGYQVALGLAARGCKIIIADVADATETKKRIIEETGNPNISILRVDFMSFKSVRSFAKEFIASEEKLHILISNVGIGEMSMEPTEDGLQKTMQTNYFSHFLLAHLLIDLLKKSAPSRIVFTSSGAAYYNDLKVENLTLDGLKDRKRYQHAYSNSKLCLIMAAQGFAEQLKGTEVTCNAIHPGLVHTGIYSASIKTAGHYAFLPYILLLLTIAFGKTHQGGAQTILHVASAKEIQNISGSFFVDCIPFIKPWNAYNKEFCQKIWLASEKIVKLEPHEKLTWKNDKQKNK